MGRDVVVVVVVVVVEVMVVEGRKEGVGANAFVVTRREREMKVLYIVWDFLDKCEKGRKEG